MKDFTLSLNQREMGIIAGIYHLTCIIHSFLRMKEFQKIKCQNPFCENGVLCGPFGIQTGSSSLQ